MFLQLLVHSGIQGRGAICVVVVLLLCWQRGSRSLVAPGHPSPMWITAGAVWSQPQQQFPDHGTICGSGVGALMITKEATAPLVAQSCNVALRIAPESSTLNLCLCPPSGSIAVSLTPSVLSSPEWILFSAMEP